MSKGSKIRISKNYVYCHVHGSFIHDGKDMEITYVSQWMNKERRCGVHNSTMIKQDSLPFVTAWMDLGLSC